MSLTNPPRRPSRRRLLIPLAVTAASISVLLAIVDVGAVAASVRQSDWRYLAAASVALLAGTAAYALRWKLLLSARVRWRDTFLAACAGHGINILLPLRFGEPARIIVLGRTSQASYSEITSTVVVERLWEQWMRLTALSAALALGLGLASSSLALGGAVLALALAAVGVALLNRNQAWVLEWAPRRLSRLPRIDEQKARDVVRQLLGSLALATRPGRLVQGGLCSLGAWACFWAFHALALLALPETLPPRETVVLSLTALALAPPSAPTSPGVYHATIAVPLVLLGFPETMLTAYAVVLHALLMLCLLPPAIIGLLRSGAPAREVLPAA